MRRYSRDEFSLVFDHTLGERLDGAPDQGLYEENASQRFVIGTRRQVDDRVFRYAHAGNALRSAYGAQAHNAFSSGEVRETQTIGAAALAGARVLTLTAVGTVTENMFAGGYACIHWEMSIYKILSNTGAAPLGTFTITLKEALEQAIDAASVVTLYRNPYADVRYMVGAPGPWPLYASTMGIPLRTIQANYYFWLQTWGPAVGIAVADIGAAESYRGLYFLEGGGLWSMSGVDANANAPANQYAGFLLAYTGVSVAAGINQPGALVHFFMQVAP